MRFFMFLLAALLLTGCGNSDLETSAYGEKAQGIVEPADPSMEAEETESDSVFFAAMPGVYPVGTDAVTFQMYYL